MFLLPATLFILTFVIFPLAMALFVSFTNAKFGVRETTIIGLRNYQNVFEDYRFFNSTYVTLLFPAIAVPLEVLLGMGMALILNRNIKFRGALRTIFLVPLFVSPISLSLMGQVIFYEGGGGLNGILKDLGLPAIRWRSDPTTAIFTVILLDVWMWTPFTFLITLASLQAVPKDLIEAAIVDGASDRALFRRIILPMITPAILTISFFRIVDTLRLFEIPFTLLGGGGPGITTETLTIYIYKTGFRGFFFGQASAISFIYLLIVSVIVMVIVQRLRRYYV
ncbi:MAG: sugar ABC transporter permease [Candidatus Caldarchaeales archaeon]